MAELGSEFWLWPSTPCQGYKWGDFCKHRPSAHLETQAQTLQSWQRNSDHGTAPLNCVGKVGGTDSSHSCPKDQAAGAPSSKFPRGWEVSSEVSEKRRGRQTAEQSQISSHGHLPCSLWRGGPVGPQAGHRPLSRLDLEMKEKRRHHCQEMNVGRKEGREGIQEG